MLRNQDTYSTFKVKTQTTETSIDISIKLSYMRSDDEEIHSYYIPNQQS